MRKRLMAILFAGILVVASVGSAFAAHGGTQQCNGINVAETATGYDTGYCPD